MSAWFRTLDSEHVYRGRSAVRLDRVATPDGTEVQREIVEHDDAVAIVPVREDGSLLLLKHYRHAVGGYVLEIPAGTLDIDGESPEEAARREMREELHHEVAELEHLTTFWNSAGWSTERTHVYVGRGLRPSGPPDGFEAEAEEADMEVVPIPADEAVGAVRAGEITDAKTVIGLLLAAGRIAG